ncbi:MAG: type II secretion system F family protein [Herpetosiphon sp.]
MVWLIVLLVFVAALVGIVIMLMRSRTGGVDARLANFTGGSVEANEPDLSARVEEAVLKTKKGAGISRDLARADIRLTAGEFYLAKMGCAATGAVLGGWFLTRISGRYSLLLMLPGAIVVGLLCSFIPGMYVRLRAKKRVKQFNDQLADTTAMLAAAVRAGSSFLQSMDLVAREARAPVAAEFKRVVQEVGLGLSTEAAMANLLRRVPSDDLDLMITAINIQHEVGGNLAQILESISHTIRERVRIKGDIRTLTAQGRASGYVITGLPVLLAVAMTAINPGYMAPIFTFGLPPVAWCCLPVTSGAMIMAGYFAIMKIVDIEV